MPQLFGSRRSYDHRIREIVCETGNPAIFQHLGKQERHVQELGAALEPFDAPRPEDVVARVRDLGALFDKSPKDAREALKHLLDDGSQLHPLEDGYAPARSRCYRVLGIEKLTFSGDPCIAQATVYAPP